MELTITRKGKEEKYWMDFELFELEREFRKKLQGLPNNYDKLFDEWQRKNKK